MEETLGIEEMIEETMKGTLELINTLKNIETLLVNFEKNVMRILEVVDISKEKIDENETIRSNSIIEFDSIKLN